MEIDRREELIRESNVSREVFESLCAHHGRDPANPIGQCFDSAAHQIVFHGQNFIDTKLCHGIGVSNMPSQKGDRFCHAWVEFNLPEGQRVALDTTWNIAQLAEQYRSDLRLQYVIEYDQQKAFDLWKAHDYPGPWDERLIALQKKKGVHR